MRLTPVGGRGNPCLPHWLSAALVYLQQYQRLWMLCHGVRVESHFLTSEDRWHPWQRHGVRIRDPQWGCGVFSHYQVAFTLPWLGTAADISRDQFSYLMVLCEVAATRCGKSLLCRLDGTYVRQSNHVEPATGWPASERVGSHRSSTEQC